MTVIGAVIAVAIIALIVAGLRSYGDDDWTGPEN